MTLVSTPRLGSSPSGAVLPLRNSARRRQAPRWRLWLVFRFLANKHASTGANPVVSVQLLNWRVRLRFPAKTGMSNLEYATAESRNCSSRRQTVERIAVNPRRGERSYSVVGQSLVLVLQIKHAGTEDSFRRRRFQNNGSTTTGVNRVPS